MNTARALNAYANVGIESNISSAEADPHKLILLLYQGALLAIASAKNQIMRKETAAKGKSISHAILIIESGLKESLNTEAGGELAQNLAALYSYMAQRLLSANLNNDIAALDEVSRLLIELRGAWESIRQSTQAAAPAPVAAVPQQPPVAGMKQQSPLVYGRM
ncbi:MAG: flagellar export chaperone FliS [Sideroxydans sp.]|nr:flagellar export chaperone FliS [Sideroxydans sp.]